MEDKLTNNTEGFTIIDTKIDPNQNLEFMHWVLIVITFYCAALTIQYAIFVLWNIIKSFWPQANLLQRYNSKQGQSWAVVTGATDGIGLGFGQQLVAKGFNVCLISRNLQKLSKVAKKLQQQRPSQFSNKKIKYIQFDFTQVQDQGKYRNLEKQLSAMDIGLFVNNVGVAFIGSFQNASYKEIVDLLNVNCLAMTFLNAFILKQNKQRKQKSAIINLSSLSGMNPLPYIALYCSTKAFNRFISEGVSIQYPDLDILSVNPMYVQSGGAKVKKQFNIPTSRQCANHSLKQLRFRQYRTLGYLTHRITGTFVLWLLPKWFMKIVSKIQMKKVVKIQGKQNMIS